MENTDLFIELSKDIVFSYNLRRFKAHFGIEPTIVAAIWIMILPYVDQYNIQPVYLLWALYYMKTYSTWDIMAAKLHKSEKSIRKWIYQVLLVL